MRQLFPQSFNLLSQRIKVFSDILIDFYLHLQTFGPFGEHKGREGVSQEKFIGVYIGK